MIEVYTDCSVTKQGAAITAIALAEDAYIGSTVVSLPLDESTTAELIGVQKGIDLVTEYTGIDDITVYCDNLNVINILQAPPSSRIPNQFRRLHSYLQKHKNVKVEYVKGHTVCFPDTTPQFAVDRLASATTRRKSSQGG